MSFIQDTVLLVSLLLDFFPFSELLSIRNLSMFFFKLCMDVNIVVFCDVAPCSVRKF